MKKVMLYAYTNLNFGDDLFIKIICERYQNVIFIISVPSIYKDKFKNIPNLKIYKNDTLFKRGINYIGRKFKREFLFNNYLKRKCDLAVYIGGSIYMQIEPWEKVYVRKNNMKIQNKPFYVIGANFGPYQEQEFYERYYNLFKSYSDICFRDEYSYNLFNKLKNVRMAPDVVFNLKPILNKTHKNNKVIISLIKPSYRAELKDSDNIYYKRMSEIANLYLEKGKEVVLMSFCENQGDMEACNNVYNLINEEYSSKVKIYSYKGNIEESLSIISSSDYVIASRFHAMIVGWIYGKPVYPIAYSKKTINVLMDNNFKGAYSEIENLKDLSANDVYSSESTNTINVLEEINSANLQFEKLDEILS